MAPRQRIRNLGGLLDLELGRTDEGDLEREAAVRELVSQLDPAVAPVEPTLPPQISSSFVPEPYTTAGDVVYAPPSPSSRPVQRATRRRELSELLRSGPEASGPLTQPGGLMRSRLGPPATPSAAESAPSPTGPLTEPGGLMRSRIGDPAPRSDNNKLSGILRHQAGTVTGPRQINNPRQADLAVDVNQARLANALDPFGLGATPAPGSPAWEMALADQYGREFDRFTPAVRDPQAMAQEAIDIYTEIMGGSQRQAIDVLGGHQFGIDPDLSPAVQGGIDTDRLLENIDPALSAERRLSRAAQSATDSTSNIADRALERTLSDQKLDSLERALDQQAQQVTGEAQQAQADEREQFIREQIDAERTRYEQLHEMGLYADNVPEHSQEAFHALHGMLESVDVNAPRWVTGDQAQTEQWAVELESAMDWVSDSGFDSLESALEFISSSGEENPDAAQYGPILTEYEQYLADPSLAAMDLIAEIVRGEQTLNAGLAALESREQLKGKTDQIEQSVRQFFGIGEDGQYALGGQPAFNLAALNDAQIAWLWGWESDPMYRRDKMMQANAFYGQSVPDQPFRGANPFPTNVFPRSEPATGQYGGFAPSNPLLSPFFQPSEG